MSQQLINHSPDLKRLRDEGYEIEVRGGYLLIHHVPYVNGNKKIAMGTLVSNLTISGLSIGPPNTHVIHFIGEHPCNVDGSIIAAIQHSSQPQDFGLGMMINHSFSNKPPAGYANQYEKVKRYVEIISAQAQAVDDSLTARTFARVHEAESDSVFRYVDTNSSRANINAINAKFQNCRVAIVGCGGTGSYILDLVAKTPVNSIELYDGDKFQQHNAFRSPGAPAIDVLEQGEMKSDYFASLYSNMHKGIISHPYYLDVNNLAELDEVDFTFVSLDNNPARKVIITHLIDKGKRFIDVGLGISVVGDKLIGGVRVTSSGTDNNDHIWDRIPFVENSDQEYSTNIQIADLNALNASLAVIRWKKMMGFYQDLEKEKHQNYEINVSKIFNEDCEA
ncbi:MAG: ThiF family adenylyltransferase [Flavobacterium sp.]|nr:MAG: ThiF family adenylyltransferase [Flavobacterium sp.]